MRRLGECRRRLSLRLSTSFPPTGGTLDGGGPRQSDLRWRGSLSLSRSGRSVGLGRTVYAPEVLQHRLFLTHLAQWPDSPGVHEIESSAAVPLITHRAVRAVVVILHPARRADSDPGTARPRRAPGERHRGAAGAGGSPRLGHPPPGQRAAIDPLTWLRDLDAFDRTSRGGGAGAADRARRSRRALIDVDALRDLNARQGTGAGDRFLAELGGILLEEIRSPDFVARYGAMSSRCSCRRPAWRGPATLARVCANRVAPWTGLSPTERPRLAAGLVTFPHPGVVRVEDLLAVAEEALVRGKTEAPIGLLAQHEEQLSAIGYPLSVKLSAGPAHRSPLTAHRSPLTAHRSPASPLTAHRLLSQSAGSSAIGSLPGSRSTGGPPGRCYCRPPCRPTVLSGLPLHRDRRRSELHVQEKYPLPCSTTTVSP